MCLSSALFLHFIKKLQFLFGFSITVMAVPSFFHKLLREFTEIKPTLASLLARPF